MSHLQTLKARQCAKQTYTCLQHTSPICLQYQCIHERALSWKQYLHIYTHMFNRLRHVHSKRLYVLNNMYKYMHKHIHMYDVYNYMYICIHCLACHIHIFIYIIYIYICCVCIYMYCFCRAI